MQKMPGAVPHRQRRRLQLNGEWPPPFGVAGPLHHVRAGAVWVLDVGAQEQHLGRGQLACHLLGALLERVEGGQTLGSQPQHLQACGWWRQGWPLPRSSSSWVVCAVGCCQLTPMPAVPSSMIVSCCVAGHNISD
jgi:hypothetical protein